MELLGGVGQGSASFTTCLQLPIYKQLTAGAGGAGSSTACYSWGVFGASGGGGGVLLNGTGPAAQDGIEFAH